ncbi:MAG TPA: hypothetical protein VIL94_12130 [Acidothermaceae bacterium]|jgi:hypothetical protein
MSDAAGSALGRPLAEVKMTYAAVLVDLGRIDAALVECDHAALVLRAKTLEPSSRSGH